jgi:hypothetical protein
VSECVRRPSVSLLVSLVDKGEEFVGGSGNPSDK